MYVHTLHTHSHQEIEKNATCKLNTKDSLHSFTFLPSNTLTHSFTHSILLWSICLPQSWHLVSEIKFLFCFVYTPSLWIYAYIAPYYIYLGFYTLIPTVFPSLSGMLPFFSFSKLPAAFSNSDTTHIVPIALLLLLNLTVKVCCHCCSSLRPTLTCFILHYSFEPGLTSFLYNLLLLSSLIISPSFDSNTLSFSLSIFLHSLRFSLSVSCDLVS